MGTNLYESACDSSGVVNECLMSSFDIDDVNIELSFRKPKIVSTLGASEHFDIYQALVEVFEKSKFVVFRCRQLTLLIWRKNPFFIFDPSGRSQNCRTGSHVGLMTLKDLTNVTHVIVNLSGLPRNSTFSLMSLKIRNVGKTRVAECPMGYLRINTHRAVMRSPYHLRHPIYKKSCNKQALAMSIVALAYTKVDPPSTWTQDHLSRILLIGNELYKMLIVGAHKSPELNLKQLPATFQLAQFAVSMKIKPFVVSVPIDEAGQECELLYTLEKYLLEGSKILLQVDRMFFAAWRKHFIFYLFDPYPRSKDGDTTSDTDGMCCIHMFSFLQELSHIFRRNMAQTRPHDEKIYVHVVDFDDVTLGTPIDVAKTLMQLGYPEPEKRFPSIVDSLKYELPKRSNNKDEVLILDTAPSVVTIREKIVLDGPQRLLETVLDDKMSTLSLNDDIELKQPAPSPSVDFLCTVMANSLAVGAVEGIIEEQCGAHEICK